MRNSTITKTRSSNVTYQGSHFTAQQISFLKIKPWWYANVQIPYLIKFSTFQNSLLLKCTDLKSVWVKKLNQEDIKRDKQIYVKYLGVKSFKHLIQLFESLLQAYDPQAKYKFQKDQTEGESTLDFKFQKLIEVYPFVWKFKLVKIDCQIVQVISRQIINPLAFTLQVQSKKHQIFRKRIEILQKQYIKKMTDMQKKMYKSPLFENQQEWRKYTKRQLHQIHQLNTTKLLYNAKFDTFASFAINEFLSSFLEIEKSKKPQIPILGGKGSDNLLLNPGFGQNQKIIPHNNNNKVNGNIQKSPSSISSKSVVPPLCIQDQDFQTKPILKKINANMNNNIQSERKQKDKKKKAKNMAIDFL